MSEDMSGGFPKDWFVGSVEDYICGFCLDVLRDPKQCKNGHLFCTTCIGLSMINNGTGHTDCPICKTDMTLSTIGASLIAKSIVEKIPVHCKCKSDNSCLTDCVWNGPLIERESRQCQFSTRECVYNGCTQKIQLRHLHDHEMVCAHRLSDCSFCAERFPFGKLEDHEANCTRKPVQCECGSTFPFHVLVAHKENDCGVKQIDCALFRAGCCDKTCTGTVQRDLFEEHVRSQHNRGADVLWAMVTCGNITKKPVEHEVPDIVEVFPKKRPRTVIDLSDEPIAVPLFTFNTMNWQPRDIVIATSREGKYIGTFNNMRQRHGKGKMQYTYGPFAGAEFVGEWANDRRHGSAVIEYPCGDVFRCSWVDDKCHGMSRRVKFDSRGEIEETFLCNYTNDVMDSLVTIHKQCGDWYSGGWKDGQREGMAVMYTEADKSTFHGTFKDDKKDGAGRLLFANGNYHRGEWRNDLKNGKGQCFENDTLYKGNWNSGMKHGSFTTVKNGDYVEVKYSRDVAVKTIEQKK